MTLQPASPGSGFVDSDWLDMATESLRRLPKVELHAHLSGCIRLSTIADLAAEGGLRFSRAVERNLSSAVVLKSPARSYGWSFLPWIRVIDKVTSIPENHFRLTYEVAQDMAEDGVVYAEIRTSVRLPFIRSSFRSMLCGLDEAATIALREHGIDVRFILGFNRHRFHHVSSSEREEIVRGVLDITEKYRHRVVGFDIWGNENRHPPRAFADEFALIRRAGYQLTMHAGEAGNVDHVRQAVGELQCRRIGHGGAVLRDLEVVNQIRDKEIAVEVCLTSNRLTGVVPEIERHPISGMIQAGIPVCLCADNTLVYATSLSREYALAAFAGLMTADQLIDNAEKGAAMTFLPADERSRLARRLRVAPKRRDAILGSIHAPHPSNHST